MGNHTIQANRRKASGQIALEHNFGFGNTSKKVTKNLGFYLTLKKIYLQDIVYITLPQATVLNEVFDILHLFVANFIPRPDTQVFFNDSMKSKFNLSFDSWTTNRRVVKISEHQRE